MGIRATVRSSVDLEYDVEMGQTLSRSKATCIKTTYTGATYSVPAPRTEAPAIKAIDYLVFVGRLVAPFVEISDSPGSPTLDDPHDVFERTITVSFAPSLVAVVGPSGARPWVCKVSDDIEP